MIAKRTLSDDMWLLIATTSRPTLILAEGDFAAVCLNLCGHVRRRRRELLATLPTWDRTARAA